MRLLSLFAVFFLGAACPPDPTPNPFVPKPAPACTTKINWTNDFVCPGMITPDLIDCIWCDGAEGCVAPSNQYCVVRSLGCGDGYCSRSLPNKKRPQQDGGP